MASHVSQCMQRQMHVGHMASHVSTCMEHGMFIKWDGDQFLEGERNKKKRKEKGKGKEIKEEKKQKRERRIRKGERKREKRRLAFRRSKLVGPRSKVRIFDEDYTPRGRDFSYFGLFSTIRAVGLCFCLKGLFGRISKYGNANLF